ncbi:hypothetical protein LSH36_8g00005, partial [Paralvinella palmiformis]
IEILMKYEKVPKVVEGQRPKLTSTLIDDVISEDVQELAFSQDLSTVNDLEVCSSEVPMLIKPGILLSEVEFSVVLSYVFLQINVWLIEADSGWDENSSVKKQPERMLRRRPAIDNRKPFTVRTKHDNNLQPKTSTLLCSDGKRPALFNDDLSTIVGDSGKNIDQPSSLICGATSGNRQSTNSNSVIINTTVLSIY